MAQYWFKPKRYGYGASPATWEGWLATFGSVAVVVGSVVVMNRLVDRMNFAAWIIWAALIVALTVAFVAVARQKTDGEWRWRWGDNDKTNRI
jgi:MFS family permease